MIRVTVSDQNIEGQRFDRSDYQAPHRRLRLDRLSAHGLQRVEMDQALADGAGGRPDVVACAHWAFPDMAGFKAGMAACGQEIMADVGRYTDIAPAVLFSEMVP